MDAVTFFVRGDVLTFFVYYIILYNHFYGDVVLTSLVRVHVLTFCARGDVKTFFKEMFFPFC